MDLLAASNKQVRSILPPLYKGAHGFRVVSQLEAEQDANSGLCKLSTHAIPYKPLISAQISISSLSGTWPVGPNWSLKSPSHGGPSPHLMAGLSCPFCLGKNADIEHLSFLNIWGFMCTPHKQAHNTYHPQHCWNNLAVPTEKPGGSGASHLQPARLPCSHNPARICHFEQDSLLPWFGTWWNRMFPHHPEKKQQKIHRLHPTVHPPTIWVATGIFIYSWYDVI